MINAETYHHIYYNFHNGPHIPDFYTRIHHEGINCQGLLHVFYKDVFAIELPNSLRSRELYFDEAVFSSITVDVEPMIGDVYLFGSPGLNDARKLHVAVLLGKQENTSVLLHATPIENGVTAWPFEKFMTYKRYSTLYRIKRFSDFSPD